MGNQKKEYIVNDNIGEPELANTFRIRISEGSFNIDYGRIVKTEDNKTYIDVVSKIILPDNKVFQLIINLLIAIKDYEGKFKKDIIPKVKSEEEVANT